MRRALAFVVVAAVLVAPACAHEQRSDGIVERWLLSLNQGAAGDPGRYAPAAISERIVPHWASLDPGQLDEIEVGPASPGEGGHLQVPFRIVTVDGETVNGIATLGGGRVLDAGTAAPVASVGSGWHVDVSPVAWFLSVIAAVLLALAASGAVILVRRTARPGRAR